MTRESPSLTRESDRCRVCGATTAIVGEKRSDWDGRLYQLGQCPACHYSFVVAPRTDFAAIYDAAYYRGEGAGRCIAYEAAVRDDDAVQRYEWRAVLDILTALLDLNSGTRWLDFGCGLGGLVRYARERGFDVVGFDEGYAAERLRSDGIPTIERSAFNRSRGSFDVVTAIEVIEHTLDPIAFLREIRNLLRPGGVFFLTTGNARRFRTRLSSWSYVEPDVHISFFEPETLMSAYERVGLEAEHPGYVRGFTGLIRSKILGTLGVNKMGVFERLVPWPIVSRLADRRYGVSLQPTARRPMEPERT